MIERYDEHYFDWAWALIRWHARHRWACSMRLALLLLIVTASRLLP